jgi:hypothetical protein
MSRILLHYTSKNKITDFAISGRWIIDINLQFLHHELWAMFCTFRKYILVPYAGLKYVG